MADTAIDIINLSKFFEGRKVLDNLNLSIRQGETMVIIGRSGCGKSVLLKHIIGLMSPDFGQVFIDKVDITSLREKQLHDLRMRFGMLFQGGALFDSLSVGENVGFALLEHTAMPKADIYKRVRECLTMVGLKGIENLKPAELSGGMKKRVALARAICMRPGIILYDEPTTGLDPIMSDAINDLIKALHDRLQVVSIVVTHDMTSAYKIGDRIAMLYNGKIIEVGTPQQIKDTANPVVRQFITGSAKGPIDQGISRDFLTNGGEDDARGQ